MLQTSRAEIIFKTATTLLVDKMMKTKLIRFVKAVFFATPLWRYFLPVTKMDMSIAQLHFITTSLEAIPEPGSVLEVGVGGGWTSIFVNNFMSMRGIERQYCAVDTFSGFTREDAEYERAARGKTSDYSGYRSNRKDWYEKTLAAHGYEASVFQADAKKFDYSHVGPVALAILDVDLYSPVADALPKIYDQLVPSGMILVHDCEPYPQGSIFDGGCEAYREFCRDKGMESKVFHGFGVVRKSLLAEERAR